MTRVVWVIGGSGLLGSAVVRAARRDARWEILDAAPLPWNAPLAEAARANARALVTRARELRAPWAIVWAAGASTVASTDEQASTEATAFTLAMHEIAAETSDVPGTLLLSSSVGAVYGGSPHPPFTESTSPQAISPYGRLKLAQEDAVREFAARTGSRAVIGRITNLYGPGQRLGKAQGLISHLVLSRFSVSPTSIFVPLETVRDYLFVDDCAWLVLDCLERAQAADVPPGSAVVKILGSGQSTSISTLLGTLRYLSKVSPAISIGTRPSSGSQARDLRVVSAVWPELDRRERTPLAAGIHATMLDVVARLQR